MAVPPPSPKPPLRRVLRLARERFAGDAGALAMRLPPLMTGVAMVGGYVAHRGEPDVMPVLVKAAADGVAIALPRVIGPGEMRYVGWSAGDRIAPGRIGVPEPEDGEAVDPDLVLVPLLGFDRAGRRLGQGGGYYDRWFASHPDARRIGIAWSVQEVDLVPEEPWDVRLHVIVTECEVIVP